MKDIIIKCFETLNGYYFYDRYTNSIVKVNQDEYKFLEEIERTGKFPKNIESVEKFIKEGLLHRKVTRTIRHPWDKDVEYALCHCLGELILQVTQQCNLRCAYCAYSGNYYNREHSNKRMSFEMAKTAIDFYLDHTDDVDNLAIAFYGGEPLLEFPLIQKCVEYAEMRTPDKEITYYITTNGTLLTEKVIPFLAKHNFSITISLDGKKEEHDINRKFKDGRGSFDLIVRNLWLMREYDKEFFSKVRYNTVINSKAKFHSFKI